MGKEVKPVKVKSKFLNWFIQQPVGVRAALITFIGAVIVGLISVFGDSLPTMISISATKTAEYSQDKFSADTGDLKLVENKGIVVYNNDGSITIVFPTEENLLTNVLYSDVPQIFGLDYDRARQLLIDSEWQPTLHLTGNYLNKEWDGNAKNFIAEGYFELFDCTGTDLGYCIFEFHDIYGNTLLVRTAGIEDPKNGYYASVYSFTLK